jgi:energy-coupling factor transport system permease protein
MIHALAWFLWLGAAVVSISITRNPLYLIVMLFEFALVVQCVEDPDRNTPVPVTPWRFVLFVVPVTALFNLLTSHLGETVLAHIPRWFPLIGGAMTAEALVYGAINGLVLAVLFTAFVVLNRAVPVRDLIRLVPRAFYPVAVVISIAVTFVPETLRQLQQIREAQMIRGHRMRGPRDWLPLFMPLLVGGLERALQLAEAMTARGFSSIAATEEKRGLARFGPLVGLLCLVIGSVLMIAWGGWARSGDLRPTIGGSPIHPTWWGAAFIAVGTLGLLLTLRHVGRRNPHTTYRQTPWAPRDWIVAGGAVVALGALLLLGKQTRAYMPYPALTWPEFDPLVGIGSLGFLCPLLFGGEREQ